MKVLVTGSAGFIGFHLVNALLKNGVSVVGIDSINDYYDVSLKYNRLRAAGLGFETIERDRIICAKAGDYRFIRMNLEEKEKLNELFREHQFEVVVNLAAQAGVRYSLTNPEAYIQSNFVGFANILECCRHYSIKHLVYASSSSVYGLNKTVPFSTLDHVDHPISLYAASKKSNELMAHVYSHLFSMPTTGLRFFTVYGPWGRPDMALFIFTKAILSGEPIELFNNGDMVRDFTYIDDIIEGLMRVIKTPPKPGLPGSDQLGNESAAPYKVYNIGNSSPVRLLEFVEALEEELGKKAIIELKPMQPGDVPVTFADVSELQKDLGYKPATSVRSGIRNFVHWYKGYYNI